MWLVSTSSVPGLPFELKFGEYLVGRSRAAQIRIKDRTVSKEHAKLVCQGKTVLVEDLGSLNHTFINGQQVKAGQAALGDDLQFGAIRCRLSVSPIYSEEDQSEGSLSTIRVLPARSPTLDISGLTPAQQEVLGLALLGLDDHEIARRTSRKAGTVHSHIKVIYEYFGVHTRAQLVARARKA